MDNMGSRQQDALPGQMDIMDWMPEAAPDDLEIVHEGLEVRGHLGFLVAGEESDVLAAEDDGRPGQDDLVEVLLLL